MGVHCAKLCCTDAKIVVFGLNSAGKTSLVNRLVFKDFDADERETIGFNFYKLDHRNARFEVWDVGGVDAVRKFWKHYVRDAAGIVYVVDSADRSRMDLAARELSALLDMEELRSAVVLVLANKQDLPDAMEPSEVAYELGLPNLTHRTWTILGTDAISGNGLYKGFDWLSDVLND